MLDDALLRRDARPPATPSGRRRLDLADLNTMLESGVLEEGERTELIGGELFVMPSEGEIHDEVLERLTALLRRALEPTLTVRQNGPLNLPPDTQVSPDLSVWPAGTPGSGKTAANVRLVVEICRNSRDNDFNVKSRRYAEAGVLDYWILEPDERRLTVRRDASVGVWRVDRVWPEPRIAPLCAPEAVIAWTEALVA